MSIQTQILAATAAVALASAPAFAAETQATIRDQEGDEIGTVTARDTASGFVLLTIKLDGLPRGPHAVHLHETGDCSAPDFTSAGGHIANGASHGIESPNGPHPGDLPNLFVGRGGAVHAEFFMSALNVQEHLLDSDGAAFVVHEKPDDYRTDPAGDSGARIACGAFAGP
jgi:superoxide dismutase, Cu-Zn family